jgi:hypothetical protein
VCDVPQGLTYQLLLDWLVLLSKKVVLSANHGDWQQTDVELLPLVGCWHRVPVCAHSLLDLTEPLDVGILHFLQGIVTILPNGLEPEEQRVDTVTWLGHINDNTYGSNVIDAPQGCLEHIGKDSTSAKLIALNSDFLLLALLVSVFEV